MNLQPYFEAQKKLDEHIIQEKGLQGQDLLDKKILALQVELGELAQNWRGFKFWSNDQEPRTYKSVPVSCKKCGGTGVFFIGSDYDCDLCNGHGEVERDSNPLLEEYVDCLHFILSIGIETNTDVVKAERFIHAKKMPNILDQIMWTNHKITEMYKDYRDREEFESGIGNYHFVHVFNAIYGLGKMLGFSEQQIHDAYFDKNATNHERQETGY